MGNLILDIETVPNKKLIAENYFPEVNPREFNHNLNVEDFYQRARTKLLEEAGSDFFPLVYHIPICAVFGFEDDLGDKFDTIKKISASRGTGWNGVKKVVETFWDETQRVHCRDKIVTFNGRGFDFPIMELYAIKFGIKIPYHFEDNRACSTRHRYGRHVDIMDLLANYGAVRRVGKLHEIAKFLGLEGKTGAGSDVLGLWEAGRDEDISAYCENDVDQTRKIYRLLENARKNED